MLPSFLQESYQTEKNLFLVPKFTLGIVGFYPEVGKSTPKIIWALFNLVVLVYFSYAEFAFGMSFLTSDPIRALDALCPVATCILSLFKVCFLWWHRAEVERLSKRVAQLTAEQNNQCKLICKRKYFAFATRLSSLVLLFGVITGVLYTTRAGLTNYMAYVRGEEIPFETPYKIIFPQPLVSMPIFPVTFTLSFWHGNITIASFSGADSLFFCFCMYFGTLLKLLYYDLCDFLAEVGINQGSERYMEREIEEGLKKIIARHNDIIDLVNQFSAVMAPMTLAHFVTSSLIIGTAVVDMLLFSDYGVFVYVTHTIALFLQLFLYCIGGTVITECSSELSNAVYSGKWYTHNVRIQRMLLLIIIRAQRSLVVKIPFFSPSLPTLTSILRFAGSLIALAKSII